MLIIYIVQQFPKLTETFVWNEIVELRKRGIRVEILSVKRGDNFGFDSQQLEEVQAKFLNGHHLFNNFIPHVYLAFTRRFKYFKVLFWIFFQRKLTLRLLISNLKAFSVGTCFLFELRNREPSFFFSHFINFPTSVALYMSLISGVPFSCSAHANDIYLGDIEDIRTKIKFSKFLITCTLANKNYLQNICDKLHCGKILHNYHGINISEWSLSQKELKRSESGAFRILSVCRFVEKKGIKYLIEAVRILSEQGLSIHCTLVGDGHLRKELESIVLKSKLENFVIFTGALAHEEIRKLYQVSECFILPSVITEKGDRDGLPNVLLEAMSSRLPIITTSISGISELVSHEITALIVPTQDSNRIAEAIMRLINDGQLYRRLIENGMKKIIEFDISNSTSNLISIFQHASFGNSDRQ